MKTMTAVLLLASLAAAGESRESVLRKLETKVSIDLKDVPLADALAAIHDATGVDIVLQGGAEATVRLSLKQVSAKCALQLMLRPAGLSAAVQDGVLVVGVQPVPVVLRVYDVRSLLVRIQDNPGPRVELAARFLIGHG